VFDIIASTILVTVPPASVEIVISSPIFNSVLNKVPKPVTEALLFATVMLPVICKLSPYVALLDTSAVYAGVPAIPICLVAEKSYCLTPFRPTASA
jgi:hypothetical protein